MYFIFSSFNEIDKACQNFIYRQHRGFVAAFASGNTSKAPSSNSLENRLRPIGLCRIASYICVNWFKSVRSLKHFILQITDRSMNDFFGFSLYFFCYTYVSYQAGRYLKLDEQLGQN